MYVISFLQNITNSRQWFLTYVSYFLLFADDATVSMKGIMCCKKNWLKLVSRHPSKLHVMLAAQGGILKPKPRTNQNQDLSDMHIGTEYRIKLPP
jgi:hypothetical protein